MARDASSASKTNRIFATLMKLRALPAILLAGTVVLAVSMCKPDGDRTGPIRTGDPAIDQLSQEIAAHPDDLDLLYRRADLFYQKDAYEQAVQDLAALMRIDSSNLPAHHLLADVYLDSYQSAQALRTMERAVALYPDSIRTRLKLSEFQLILKQYDGAYQTLQGILAIRPNHPEALFMLGLTFRDQGKTEQAIGALQKAVEQDPSMAEAWVILGDLMDRTKNPLAGQYFDNAIRVDPASVAAWHAKAYYLQNNDRIAEAIDIYKKIHTLDVQYPEAYLNAAILYLYQDSLDAAEKEVDILNRIDPTNAAGWFYKGRVLQSRNMIPEARSMYEQALRLDPDYGQAQDALQEIGK